VPWNQEEFASQMTWRNRRGEKDRDLTNQGTHIERRGRGLGPGEFWKADKTRERMQDETAAGRRLAT
jgi:hypothetical protein